MLKYGKVLNEKTGLCEVGTGTNYNFYKSIGYTELNVQQSDIDNGWYLIDQCPMKTDEEKAAEEAERIAMLNLTAADVERAIYKAKGLDFDDIIALVEQNNEAANLNENETTQSASIDIKALKIELRANNFYRGNPYIDAVGTILGFTKQQLDEFFETNDYTKLLTTPELTNTNNKIQK